MAAATEGTVPFRGYRTWYQMVGRLPAVGGGLPLLVVHGGPGLPHDYPVWPAVACHELARWQATPALSVVSQFRSPALGWGRASRRN